MEQVRSENYSKAELAVLRDYIVVNANELAEQMERDADGYLIYKGDMNQAAVEAMQQVGTDYGRLQGYYPQPKEIYFSELLSQTYRMGYYFPFSMEANYNGCRWIPYVRRSTPIRSEEFPSNGFWKYPSPERFPASHRNVLYRCSPESS